MTWAYNVSARQASVKLDCGEKIITVFDFPDDNNPVEIEQIRFGEPKLDINGALYIQHKRAPIIVTLSVLPGTKSDKDMTDLVHGIIFDYKRSPKIKMTVTYRLYSENPCTEEYLDGEFIESDVGYSATSNGRVKTKTYKFAFKLPSSQG